MQADFDRSLMGTDPRVDRRLHDIGWGLLLMWSGALWLLPARDVPDGTWLFGVAGILFAINAARYFKHVAVSGFTLILAVGALIAAVGQAWGTDPPLVAIFLVVIGAVLVLRPLLHRAPA